MDWIKFSNLRSETGYSMTERCIARSSRLAVLDVPGAAAMPSQDPRRRVLSGVHRFPNSLSVPGCHGLGTGKSVA
jgi:hypothetical protein